MANGITLTSAFTTLQTSLSLGTPPQLSQAVLAPKPVSAYTGSNGTKPVVLSYAELSPSADLTVTGTVTLTFGFPPGTLDPSTTYLFAFWLGNLSLISWIDGNAVNAVDFSAQTITITGSPNFDFRGGFIYGFAIYHN